MGENICNTFKGKRLFSLKYRTLLKINKENTPNTLEQYKLIGISLKNKHIWFGL